MLLHVLVPVTYEKPAAFVPTHDAEEQLKLDGRYTHSGLVPLQYAPHVPPVLSGQPLEGSVPAALIWQLPVFVQTLQAPVQVETLQQ